MINYKRTGALRLFVLAIFIVFISEVISYHLIDFLNITDITRQRIFSVMFLTLLLSPLFYFISIKVYRQSRLKSDELKSILGESLIGNNQLKNEILGLKGSAEYATEIIFITNRQGVIIYANPQFSKVYGYPLSDVVGKNTPRILKGGFLSEEDYRKFWKSLLSKKNQHIELVNRTSSGRLIPVEASTNAILDDNNEIIGFFALQRDITERKRSEVLLKQSIKQAEDANRAKSTFLATMSHEIRTPLNAILGMSELLRNDKLNDEQLQFLDVIRSAGRTLLQVVNDILDFSKMDAKRFVIKPVDFELIPVIENAQELFRLSETERNLAFSLQIDPRTPTQIHNDPERLSQVLFNLLSNAIKFTEAGEISIKVEPVKHNNGSQVYEHIRFIIDDSGIGIAPEIMQNIFNKYHSEISEKVRIKYGGTGLGLAIAKELVELMGGEIEINSPVPDRTPANGTRVSFTIKVGSHPGKVKISNASRSTLTKTDRKSSLLRNKKILLAEDDVSSRLLMKTILENESATVDIAPDGAVAVKLATQNDYDIILMDMQMPNMDGCQATERIRMDVSKPIPIIAISANSFQEDIDRCLNSGMNHFLSKPVNRKELMDILAKL